MNEPSETVSRTIVIILMLAVILAAIWVPTTLQCRHFSGLIGASDGHWTPVYGCVVRGPSSSHWTPVAEWIRTSPEGGH